MTGPSCTARTRLVAATSSPSDDSGFWTMLTLYPSFLRTWYTPCQPEPSTHAPCTRTMFFMPAGAAFAGAAVAANATAAAAASRVRFEIIEIFSFSEAPRPSRCLNPCPPAKSMLRESGDMGLSGVRSSGLHDASARCLAVEPTADIRDRILVKASVKAAGDVADMRRCQQVRQRAERMAERQRLLVGDIDGCTGARLSFKRRNEICLARDRSARRVYQARRRLHEC